MNSKLKIIIPVVIVAVLATAVYSTYVSSHKAAERAYAHAIADNIKMCQAQVKKHPNDVRNHELLAVLFCKAGDTGKALNEVHIAMKLVPGCPGHYHTIGTIYEKQRKNELALKSYELSVKLLGKHPTPSQQTVSSYSSLAGMYDVLGKRSEAIRYYVRAQVDLQNPQVRALYGDCQLCEMDSHIASRLDALKAGSR